MTQGKPTDPKKEPWVKVKINANGEISVVGEGFSNAIEIITALQSGIAAVQQQLVNTARIAIPGINFPPQRRNQ